MFKVNKCTDEGINLKSEAQMETFLECVKNSQEVMIRWVDRDEEEKHSKILITDNLMSQIKDGRFVVTSTKEDDEE